jgi:hypothetical protein
LLKETAQPNSCADGCGTPVVRKARRNKTPFPTGPGDLAGDLLRGAGAIAVFLFGSAQERRKVYHLAEISRLPTFHLGSLLCARKSVLLQWIAEQEKRGGQSGK